MNTVTNSWLDKKNRMGRLKINGYDVGIEFVNGPWSNKKFNYSQWLGVTVANDWNMSNPIEIKAATMAALVKKIEKHQYRLVRFYL